MLVLLGGLILAVISSVCSSYASVIMKISHNKQDQYDALKQEYENSGTEVPPELESKQRLDHFKRWLFVLFMYAGNVIFRFVALALVPLSIIAPSSAVTIAFNAVLAKYYFNERLSTLGVIGTLLILIGSAIAVVVGSKEENDYSVPELIALYEEPFFYVFAIVQAALFLLALFYTIISIRAALQPLPDHVLEQLHLELIKQTTAETDSIVCTTNLADPNQQGDIPDQNSLSSNNGTEHTDSVNINMYPISSVEDGGERKSVTGGGSGGDGKNNTLIRVISTNSLIPHTGPRDSVSNQPTNVARGSLKVPIVTNVTPHQPKASIFDTKSVHSNISNHNSECIDVELTQTKLHTTSVTATPVLKPSGSFLYNFVNSISLAHPSSAMGNESRARSSSVHSHVEPVAIVRNYSNVGVNGGSATPQMHPKLPPSVSSVTLQKSLSSYTITTAAPSTRARTTSAYMDHTGTHPHGGSNLLSTPELGKNTQLRDHEQEEIDEDDEDDEEYEIYDANKGTILTMPPRNGAGVSGEVVHPSLIGSESLETVCLTKSSVLIKVTSVDDINTILQEDQANNANLHKSTSFTKNTPGGKHTSPKPAHQTTLENIAEVSTSNAAPHEMVSTSGDLTPTFTDSNTSVTIEPAPLMPLPSNSEQTQPLDATDVIIATPTGEEGPEQDVIDAAAATSDVLFVTRRMRLQIMLQPYQRSILVICVAYIGACMAGWMNLTAKSFMAAIKESIKGNNQFGEWKLYLIMLGLLASLLLTLKSLSFLMSLFDAVTAVPIYQSMLIIALICVGIFYFDEFQDIDADNLALFCVGILLCLVGIVILTQQKPPENKPDKDAPKEKKIKSKIKTKAEHLSQPVTELDELA